jgi:hypothetical protein
LSWRSQRNGENQEQGGKCHAPPRYAFEHLLYLSRS